MPKISKWTQLGDWTKHCTFLKDCADDPEEYFRAVSDISDWLMNLPDRQFRVWVDAIRIADGSMTSPANTTGRR